MGELIPFKHPRKTNIDLKLVRGGKHFVFTLPFEIKGMGITCHPDRDNNGWFTCMVTLRAFEKLRNDYPIIEQAYEANEDYELVERLKARNMILKQYQ